jgi:hypothetical protein
MNSSEWTPCLSWSCHGIVRSQLPISLSGSSPTSLYWHRTMFTICPCPLLPSAVHGLGQQRAHTVGRNMWGYEAHHVNPVIEMVTISETLGTSSIFIWMVIWKTSQQTYILLFLLSICELELIKYDEMTKVNCSYLFSILQSYCWHDCTFCNPVLFDEFNIRSNLDNGSVNLWTMYVFKNDSEKHQ